MYEFCRDTIRENRDTVLTGFGHCIYIYYSFFSRASRERNLENQMR